MPLRYAVIGTGMMGQEHIRNIALLDDAEIVAIADTDESMREQAKATALEGGSSSTKDFSSHADLLASCEVDAFVVVTPNDTHHPIMRDILATGQPVLLEKPAATTTEHAWSLAKAAHDRLAPVWVGMEYRFMPAVTRLIDETKSGAAGNPKMVSIVEHRFPFLDKVELWNRSFTRTGGTMVEKCCHFFDLMRLLTASEPVRIYASGAQDVNFVEDHNDPNHRPVIDNALVIVDFENGMRASLDLCMFAEGSWWQEQVSVMGDKAKLVASVPGPARFNADRDERLSRYGVFPRGSAMRHEEDVQIDQRLIDAGDHHGSTYFQHKAFADMVLNKSEPQVSLNDGAMAVEMGAAAEQSILEKRSIEIGARPLTMNGAG
ncbi:MAG: Gfo/Idh/MocA family oxidoreductase [Pseudomonadota bacterium]